MATLDDIQGDLHKIRGELRSMSADLREVHELSLATASRLDDVIRRLRSLAGDDASEALPHIAAVVRWESGSFGDGFVLDVDVDGKRHVLFVTDFHVLSPHIKVRVASVELACGERLPLPLWAGDTNLDLAVLRLDAAAIASGLLRVPRGAKHEASAIPLNGWQASDRGGSRGGARFIYSLLISNYIFPIEIQ
jgi:hypothetical protein